MEEGYLVSLPTESFTRNTDEVLRQGSRGIGKSLYKMKTDIFPCKIRSRDYLVRLMIVYPMGDRLLLKTDKNPYGIDSLNRLSIVGHSGMEALSYHLPPINEKFFPPLASSPKKCYILLD